MFTIPNTKALALGGAGILIVFLFVLFRNQTSSDAEPNLPKNTSPDRCREQELPSKGKFPWEAAKVPNPNALSESEEREFIREKIIPLSLQLPILNRLKMDLRRKSALCGDLRTKSP